MTRGAEKLATYDDLLKLPDHLVGEILAGELHTSPRPGPRHARASSVLGGKLTGPFDEGNGGPGGWWILDEPELHLGKDILVPDLAGWRRSKLPKLPTDQAYFEISPDWVCEVLSDRTAGLDRVKKLPIYSREKVDHVWLIDPDKRTLEVYLREGNRWILFSSFAGAERVRAAPFDAEELDLGALWLPEELPTRSADRSRAPGNFKSPEIREIGASNSSKSGEAHPWRPCPLGQHWVITHPYHVPPSKKNPEGGIASQSGHCRTNRSKLDHLYKDDIIEIANRHFAGLTGPPSDIDLGFKKAGTQYDKLIRGWTRYWNEVLNPEVPLDPNLVKALIASESSFNPAAWNHKKGKAAAHGLMQVLNASVSWLKDPKELKDHFVNLSDSDMTEPNLNICAGIRWLFRKKQIADATSKHPVSWRDAVASFKGVKPEDKRLMPKLDSFYKRLRENP